MTSDIRARHIRKSHFVAMEPASINGRLLHQTSNNISNNNSQIIGQNSSNNLLYSGGTRNPSASNDRRNTIVKQFGDSKQQQQPGDQFAVGNHSNQVENREKDESDKNHVGSVMGIFFKVWSLVKVTKVRHSSKMGRQNSEDASQFRYVSGDQLPSGCNHRPALLQDRHFRRAGSQPAPSTSFNCQPLDIQQQSQPMARLQVAASPASAGSASHFVAHQNSLANTTTGTSSTSSGVSSTSSCVGQTLTSNNQTPSPPASGSASGTRRHLSAYSLRQSTDEVLVPAKTKPVQANNKSSAGDSWASKIKRSATTVNQTDFSSYVSRYRFRRDQPTNGGRQRERGSSSQHFSRDTTPVHESEPRLFNVHSDNHDSNNNNNNNKNNITNDNYNLDLMTNEGDDDEATSNDIYSTPNDSIQSVPSTDPVISNEKLSYGVSSTRQLPSQAHPITKSFSTSSFNQLLKQQQQQQPLQQQQKFMPIRESGPADDNKGNSYQAASDYSHRLNSTRFFLSSSSSEDSNNQSTSAANANASSNSVRGNNQTSAAPSACQHPQDQTHLEQHQQQVAIQQGVHCHPLQVHRPDTLFIHSQPGPYPMPVSLLTPAAYRGLALPLGPSSPLDCLPVGAPPLASGCDAASAASAAHHRQPLHRLPPSYLRSGYRKSPSLLEISSKGQGPLPARGLSSRFSSKYPIQSSRVQVGPSAPLEGIGFRANVGSKVAPPNESRAYESVWGTNEQLAPPVPNSNSDSNTNTNSNINSISTSQQQQLPHPDTRVSSITQMPNSISLHDCKLSSQNKFQQQHQQQQQQLLHYPPQLLENELNAFWPEAPAERQTGSSSSEYRLAQMLLECGSNPSSKDGNGFTLLMHAVLSDNLPAVRCLVEHGAEINDTNQQDHSALDLLCSRAPTRGRLELLKLLIDNGADLDRTRASDGTRLLDRLIDEHHHCADKLPFIDCLLQNGAKLGSSTWSAANEKYEIQLRLLQKLCQDGYFLYKKSSIEAAVYRFEYALKRLAELEQQLASKHFHPSITMALQNFIPLAAQQIKYQTYLGLSRCERKRKFYKRALEFAHLAILVDSTSYEGYYSKAHILKDLGNFDDALLAIDQTQRLVVKSIDSIELALNDLQQQQEDASIFDGCFSRLDQRRSNWVEASRMELNETLDYMQEAKIFVSRLKTEIMDDKLKRNAASSAEVPPTSQQTAPFSTTTNPQIAI